MFWYALAMTDERELWNLLRSRWTEFPQSVSSPYTRTTLIHEAEAPNGCGAVVFHDEGAGTEIHLSGHRGMVRFGPGGAPKRNEAEVVERALAAVRYGTVLPPRRVPYGYVRDGKVIVLITHDAIFSSTEGWALGQSIAVAAGEKCPGSLIYEKGFFPELIERIWDLIVIGRIAPLDIRLAPERSRGREGNGPWPGEIVTVVESDRAVIRFEGDDGGWLKLQSEYVSWDHVRNQPLSPSTPEYRQEWPKAGTRCPLNDWYHRTA